MQPKKIKKRGTQQKKQKEREVYANKQGRK